jgi:MerR family transcriptional regulator/heat shock protein HspR
LRWVTGNRRPDISSKEISDDLPVFIISSAAEVLGLHQRTLYIYEEKGLIVPVRKGNRRFYSAGDLEWIRTIRYLIHERGINLEGLRQLLAMKAQLAYQSDYQERFPECEAFVQPTAPCWQEGRTQLDCHTCPVYGAAIGSLCEDQGVPSLVL